MNLNERAQEAAEDSQQWFPETAHDIGLSIICIAGEVGEMANNYKKTQRYGSTRIDSQDKLEIGSELIDVLVYSFKLAAQLGIDLEEMYDDKRRINQHRFGSH